MYEVIISRAWVKMVGYTVQASFCDLINFNWNLWLKRKRFKYKSLLEVLPGETYLIKKTRELCFQLKLITCSNSKKTVPYFVEIQPSICRDNIWRENSDKKQCKRDGDTCMSSYLNI